MVLSYDGHIKLATIVDADGNRVALIFDGSVWRLAVDATISGGPVVIGAVEIDDGGGGVTRLMVKPDGGAVPAAPNDGGAVIAGRDGSTIRHVKVNSAGELVVATEESPVTFSAPTFATVGVASGLVLAANALRRAAILTVTTPGARVSLGFTVAAVLDSGITVFQGQPVVLDANLMSTQAINAISNVAGTNLAIQEAT